MTSRFNVLLCVANYFIIYFTRYLINGNTHFNGPLFIIRFGMLVVDQYILLGNTFQYLHNIVQKGTTALMIAKERFYNLDLVHLIEEAVRNTAVSREQVNTFCSIVCNYTLRQPIPASGTKQEL